MDERIGGVERVQRDDEPVEPLAVGRAPPGPRRQPQPVAEPAGVGEHVELAARPELGGGDVERPVEGVEVGDDVVAAEQLVGERATPGEQLDGHLAPQHREVGDALAGPLLGERVEAAHALGREQEQVAPAGVEEGVAGSARAPASATTGSSTGPSHGSGTAEVGGAGSTDPAIVR